MRLMLFSTWRVSVAMSPDDQLLGGGIDGHLAGDEDEIAGADGRRIGTARRGDAGRRDAFDHELVSFRFEKSFDFDGRHAARAGRR